MKRLWECKVFHNKIAACKGHGYVGRYFVIAETKMAATRKVKKVNNILGYYVETTYLGVVLC